MKQENNSVIVTMTEEHSGNDIYDRMIGSPDNTRNRNMMECNIIPGTVLYINYVGIGISKIVEAIDYPYIDTTVVPEWDDGEPENYAARVKTKLIVNIEDPIKPQEIVAMGIRYKSTGNVLPIQYAQQSILPIPEEDGYKITRMVSIRYWKTIDRNSRMVHLDEIVDGVTEALGDDGISYLDTTINTLPNEWYYNIVLSDMIEEGRDIMNSLGIERLQMPK